eukprot:scaffold105954_cov75-Phaeocystis_antarctica.AAC.3
MLFWQIASAFGERGVFVDLSISYLYIEPRSSPDRAPIEPRSSRDRAEIEPPTHLRPPAPPPHSVSPCGSRWWRAALQRPPSPQRRSAWP